MIRMSNMKKHEKPSVLEDFKHKCTFFQNEAHEKNLEAVKENKQVNK